MQIVNIDKAPKEPGGGKLFTGEVSHQWLVRDSNNYNAVIVNFGHGIRNKFHIHECDQLLIVTAGKGIVATEQEQRAVEVGDVILSPAGEKHWHGAAPDSEFSHISITAKGGGMTQVED